MARNETERSVRRDPSLRADARDPRIDQNRRFYTARGNDSAVRTARALQEALGVGVEAYGEHLERENEKGSKQAIADAAKGHREMLDTNKGYEETYQRIEAANDLAEMNRDLSKRLTDAGWEDLPQAEVQGMIDGYFQEQLTGINPESVYGALMGEGILKANADLLDVHNTNQLQQDQQERRTMLLNAARSSLELNGELDYEQLMADSATLLPGRGGRMTFMELLDTLATELGRPDILENAPETFPNGEPTGVNDPKFRSDWLNPAISRAEQVKLRQERQAEATFLEQNQTRRARLQADIDARADSGDASVVHDILAAGTAPEGEVPLLTEAGQRAALNRLRLGQARTGMSENYEVLFRSGNGAPLTPAEYNAAAFSFAKKEAETLKAENPEMSEEDINKAVMESTIERSIANDRLPKFVTDQFMVSTRNPDRLADAADLRRLIEENSPGLVERSISDLHSGRLEYYEQLMVETGGDVERTIEAMERADKTLSRGRTKEIGEIAATVVDVLADDDKFWGSAPTVAADYRRAEELVKLYMEMGVPDEQIADMVGSSFRARNVRVGGALYPADAGWSGHGEDALDWYLKGGSGDLWGEDPDLYAVPHPHNKGEILVRNANSGLLYAAPYSIAEIEASYKQHLRDQFDADVVGSGNTESAAYQEAKRRAAERMFPDMSRYAEPGSREDFFGSPQVQFNNLSQEEQRAAIEAEYARTQ